MKKKIALAVILSSLVFQDSKAVLPLAIPVVAVLETFVVPIVTGSSIGLAAYGIYQHSGAALKSSVGSFVNSVKLWTQGQSASSPASVQVSVDPRSLPRSAPASWKVDSATGLAYNPAVNSPSSTSSGPALFSIDTAVGCNYATPVKMSGVSLSSIASALASASTAACQFSYGANQYSVGEINEQTGSMHLNCIEPRGYTCDFSLSAARDAQTDNSNPPLSPTSPPMLPSDGKCDIKRVGNSFSADPQDPDCSSPPSGVSLNGNTVVSDNGAGSSTTITINPDGSVRVVSRSPSASGAQTIENITDIAPPVSATAPSSAVTGQKTNVYDGVGTSVSGAPVQPVSNVAPVAEPGAAVPSDIAKNSTLEAVKTDLDKIADESVPVVPGLPSVPKFYDRVYPDGFKSVWDKHSSTLQNASMFKAIGKFVPSWGGGQCPSFQIDLSLSGWANYGSHDISIPCTVWDIVGALTMLSAVFAARRIIFGG